jgi:Na+/proline symporter
MATMSTADGAILALGTVMANNVFRQLDVVFPDIVNPDNLLIAARISTLPLTLAATAVAAFYRETKDAHANGSTGSLLIVAFDVVLATVVVPLFGAFYAKHPSPRAALFSILGGGLSRIVMEFCLPKDGSLFLPFRDDEFLDYGPAASKLPPPMVNATDVWEPSTEPCKQTRYEDYTGVDSLAALLISLVVFLMVQFVEHKMEKPLFNFPGLVGYEKELHAEVETVRKWTSAAAEVFFVVFVSQRLRVSTRQPKQPTHLEKSNLILCL